MKLSGLILRGAMVLGLVGSSLPSWACANSCSPNADKSLACVRQCAHEETQVTQGGKVPALASHTCRIQYQSPEKATVLAPAFTLAAPDAVFAGSVEASTLLVVPVMEGSWLARAPPLGSSYLSYDHPQANAPPSLV